MKWCDNCGGPRWRDPDVPIQWIGGVTPNGVYTSPAGCRLCYLEEGHYHGNPFAWESAYDEWFSRADGANSTDNSPATSQWLPANAQATTEWTLRYWPDEERYRVWLSTWCEVSP